MASQIGTFGAVFETAIALEQRLADRYRAQSAHQPSAGAQAIYGALAEDGAKRLARLERIRRETVTEMILEPITDLRLGDDLAAVQATDAATPLSPTAARDLELSASRFYEEAADKIGLAEAARALRRLGKESAKRAEQLTGL